MPDTLLNLQCDFATALRDRDRTAALAPWLAGDAAHAERRVAIYRANMVAAADKALSAAYPVIRQVVGPEFFHGLAREYQRATPSTSGDLHEFGAAFDTFLARFEHVQDMPWLPDVARLEWAAHRAYGAPDAPGWDPASLATVDPDAQPAIRFQWTPGLAVVTSTRPIVRIWTLHQPGYAGDFSVAWELAETALVARDGFVATVAACTLGEAAFVAASQAGHPLGDAAEAALQQDPHFDLGALLGRALRDRLVCGFTL
ncbi:MAG: putative DNA-binding domain-containing protein [Caulobacter sp.]|nr:putative DNA-binding domain-containing protein [Vitreoscilla sp.]